MNKSNVNAQRHQDSLFFKYSHHCDQAIKILSTDCLYLKTQGVVVYLNEKDIKKLEALQPLIKKCTLKQLQNISASFSSSDKPSILNLLIQSFNKNCGWFFKNGNK